MKKVGILTFHYADSYGAVLQAYALRTVINKFEDCEAELINYMPEGYQYRPYSQNADGLAMFKEKIDKLNSFVREFCNVKGPIIHEILGNEYDCYCVGSDQVWNTDLRENVNMEYFLPRVSSESFCFSYAASIGKTVDKLNSNVFTEYLPRFRYISLRESKDYAEYIYEKCHQKCVQVLDPTLLLEKKEYEQLITKEKLMDKPFIFFYWLSLDDQLMKYIDYVNYFARLFDLRIVHNIADTEAYGFVNDDICMLYAGVEDYLWYIKNADYVITNSYHAAIFSVVFERKFFLHIAEKRRSRLDTLCELLHIQDRVIEEYKVNREWDAMPDFVSVRERIQAEKEKSIDFLLQVLDNVEAKESFQEKKEDVYIVPPYVQSVFEKKNDKFQKDMNRLHYKVALAYLRKKIQGWCIGDFLDKLSDKKIVIYAVTDFTDLICEDLAKCELINPPQYICDINDKHFGGMYKGMEVKGFDALIRDYKEGNIHKIINTNIFRQNEIINNLTKAGVSYEDIIPLSIVIWD